MTDFSRALPPVESDRAQQIVKDPYQCDFPTVAEDAKERDLEPALVARVKDVLLEIGKGFAFIGSQHHLEIGGQAWYIDRLFYHRRLRCLVAVDRKIGAFQPEPAGKMTSYLAALDDTERQSGDGPSIGLILCRERNRVVVACALRHVSGPIGVAEYRVLVADALPAALAEALPSAAESETGIGLPQDAQRRSAQPRREHPRLHATHLDRVPYLKWRSANALVYGQRRPVAVQAVPRDVVPALKALWSE